MVQYSAQLDATFAALSDPTRRGILERLGRGDASISDLAASFEMTLTGIKKHVAVLEDGEAGDDGEGGPGAHLQAGPPPARATRQTWIAKYRQMLEARLDRLGEFLGDGRKDHRHERSREGPSPNRRRASPPPATARSASSASSTRRATGCGRRSPTPTLVAQWWGRGNKLVIERMEVVRGGHWRFVEHGPEGVHGFEGRYREVTPMKRVVQTFEWDGMPGYVVIETVTLEDAGPAAPGSSTSGCSTPPRSATACCSRAWRAGSTRATRRSTGCSRR